MKYNNIIDRDDCIIIAIDNKSINPIYDLKILDVSTLGVNNFGYEKDISIEVENFDITYKDLLEYLKIKSLKIDKTVYFSTVTKQLFELAQFKNDSESISIIPDIENYKYCSVMKCNHVPYELNKDSIIRIKTLMASTTLKIYLKK